MSAPILREFGEALNIEEKWFGAILAEDRIGLVLKAAISEVDWYSYKISRVESPTPEQEEEFSILQLGLQRLIKLSLETRSSFEAPTVTFRREKNLTASVLQILAGLGMVEHGRRVAQMVAAGRCQIELAGKNDFLITLPSFMADEGYYERAIADYYRTHSRNAFTKLFHSAIPEKIHSDVERLLRELVYPFREHYIGYDADQLLDGYFYGIASSEVQLYDGYDTFHYSARFRGIPFQKYVLGLKYFVSIFMRHERFAEALVGKVPTIKLENVITISSETQSFLESMVVALDYFGSFYEGFEKSSIEEARQIFDVLSISRKSTALLSRPASALPLLIQCSDQHVIRCMTAIRGNPVQFLLDSLRHHFPSEYDQHQKSRETTMQMAVKRVLKDYFLKLEFLENIKVKVGGAILTDIDLAVLEPSTGVVYLCQLKHQELFGDDLHLEQVRSGRLKEEVDRWMAATSRWMDAVGESGIRSSLRISRRVPKLAVQRLIISRHFAYPLRHLSQIPGAVYANWGQLVNALAIIGQRGEMPPKLEDLATLLKESVEPAGLREYLPEPRREWILRGMRFVVCQNETLPR